MNIDWSKQHCGVHQATAVETIVSMPDLGQLIATFPEDPTDFTWDVKVHMLMPNQYPCIPNWHFDNIFLTAKYLLSGFPETECLLSQRLVYACGCG